MLSFTANIPFRNSHLQATFQQIAAPHEKFFIEFNSKAGHNCFEMQMDNYGVWQIIHPVEDWILAMQNQLSKIILSKLNWW